jgi:hypothetical protein
MDRVGYALLVFAGTLLGLTVLAALVSSSVIDISHMGWYALAVVAWVVGLTWLARRA